MCNKRSITLLSVVCMLTILCSCSQSQSTSHYLPRTEVPYSSSDLEVPNELFIEIRHDNEPLILEAPVIVKNDGNRPVFKTKQVYFTETIFKRISAYFSGKDIDVDIGSEKSVITESGIPMHCVLFPDYLSVQLDNNDLIQLESWVQAGDAYPGEPYGTRLENVLINENQANEIAEKVLFDLGISGMVQVSGQKARVIAENNDTVSEGWYLGFKKQSHYVDIDFNFLSPFEDTLKYVVGDMIAPFPDEMIYMYITEDGVRFFRWNNPYIITETISNNASLLSFDRIQEKAHSFFHLRYDDVEIPDEWLPELSAVILTSCHIHDARENSSILTPTWMFIFSSDFFEKNYLPPFVLSFDAMSGEIIEPLYIQQ